MSRATGGYESESCLSGCSNVSCQKPPVCRRLASLVFPGDIHKTIGIILACPRLRVAPGCEGGRPPCGVGGFSLI